MNYIIVAVLVLFSGLFSGLTLGLLSLDKQELVRKISLGDKAAKKVYSVRKNGNLLLCTLLLGNVAVNSTLAIFLGGIASGVMAGILATALIVVFGEIIPQASISRYALVVGAKTAWLVRIFIIVLSPVCYPLAWVLDKALGDEMPSVYSKGELMKIVEEHELSKESDVDKDEYRIIRGALSFSDKNAEDVMTPRTVLYALEEGEVLDEARLKEIQVKGFTRIPVYVETIDNIRGLLFVKDLIGKRPGIKLGSVTRSSGLMKVNEKDALDDVLNRMLTSKSHMGFVMDEFGGLSGILTLEDIIEEIFDIEIMDETDQIEDMRKLAKGKG
ncbi:MAG: CNNM domain-containing protein [Patescibacteria group bacterium]|nr:CNNM domain-containing protein [Patescibacteria group bacterium]